MNVIYIPDKHLTYPFPLKGGEMAYFALPQYLSKEDAERLCKCIQSLIIENKEEVDH